MVARQYGPYVNRAVYENEQIQPTKRRELCEFIAFTFGPIQQ